MSGESFRHASRAEESDEILCWDEPRSLMLRLVSRESLEIDCRYNEQSLRLFLESDMADSSNFRTTLREFGFGDDFQKALSTEAASQVIPPSSLVETSVGAHKIVWDSLLRAFRQRRVYFGGQERGVSDIQSTFRRAVYILNHFGGDSNSVLFFGDGDLLSVALAAAGWKVDVVLGSDYDFYLHPRLNDHGECHRHLMDPASFLSLDKRGYDLVVLGQFLGEDKELCHWREMSNRCRLGGALMGQTTHSAAVRLVASFPHQGLRLNRFLPGLRTGWDCRSMRRRLLSPWIHITNDELLSGSMPLEWDWGAPFRLAWNSHKPTTRRARFAGLKDVSRFRSDVLEDLYSLLSGHLTRPVQEQARWVGSGDVLTAFEYGDELGWLHFDRVQSEANLSLPSCFSENFFEKMSGLICVLFPPKSGEMRLAKYDDGHEISCGAD